MIRKESRIERAYGFIEDKGHDVATVMHRCDAERAPNRVPGMPDMYELAIRIPLSPRGFVEFIGISDIVGRDEVERLREYPASHQNTIPKVMETLQILGVPKTILEKGLEAYKKHLHERNTLVPRGTLQEG